MEEVGERKQEEKSGFGLAEVVQSMVLRRSVHFVELVGFELVYTPSAKDRAVASLKIKYR